MTTPKDGGPLKAITVRLRDGTTQTLEGEILSVGEVRGHPYLVEGIFKFIENSGSDESANAFLKLVNRHENAIYELRRFQAMGELPVEDETQYTVTFSGNVGTGQSLDWKTFQLSPFFPTREAAEQALADFGGWEHLRRVRRQFHMVGEGE
jgi:hypothetical protein